MSDSSVKVAVGHLDVDAAVVARFSVEVPYWATSTEGERVCMVEDWQEVSGAGLGWDLYVSTVKEYSTAAEYLDSLDGGEQEDASPVPVVDTGVVEEAAEEDEAAARMEADKVLKATSRAFVKGEKAYRAGLLEAGRLADEYVHRRLALEDSRSAAVDCVRLELQRFASGKVDVNRLIASYWAFDLLAVKTGLAESKGGKRALAESVPYGHYKAAFALLVDRTGKDTAGESWMLLAGMEDECRELYRKAVESGLSRDACEEQVKELCKRHAGVVAEQRRTEAAEKKAAADAVAAKLAQERAECGKLAQARDAATDEAEKARLAAELKATQEKAAATAVAESQAVKDVAKAEVAVKVADKAVERADAKAEAVQERKSGKATAPREPEGKLENLLRTGKNATVKDAAEMAAALVSGHGQPDDVLECVLQALKHHKDSSRVCKRACDAALTVLANAGKVAPAAVNAVIEQRGGIGQLATAVAG